MWLIVSDSFLSGIFCSAVASYKTDKINRAALTVFFGQLLPTPSPPSIQDIWALSKGTVFPFRMSIIKSVYFKFGVGCIVKAWLSRYLGLCKH